MIIDGFVKSQIWGIRVKKCLKKTFYETIVIDKKKCVKKKINFNLDKIVIIFSN